MAEFIVGLTGGIGSGKTTVANQFAALGIGLADADIIAREVVEPGQPALARIFEHFGQGLRLSGGALDRRALRSVVFEQPEQRRWLEQLLHPLIRERTIARLRAIDSPYALLVSPLLLETDQHELTHHILVIDLPEHAQISRTVDRDNNSEAQVKAIMESQISRPGRLHRADSVLDNSLPLSTLASRVSELDQRFRLLASTHQAQENCKP